MPTQFASGRFAHGFCDRCNFRFPLKALRSEVVAGRTSSALVCPSCYDPDHPQNWQGRYPVNDPQALQKPRPDPSLAASREIPDNP